MCDALLCAGSETDMLVSGRVPVTSAEEMFHLSAPDWDSLLHIHLCGPKEVRLLRSLL